METRKQRAGNAIRPFLYYYYYNILHYIVCTIDNGDCILYNVYDNNNNNCTVSKIVVCRCRPFRYHMTKPYVPTMTLTPPPSYFRSAALAPRYKILIYP